MKTIMDKKEKLYKNWAMADNPHLEKKKKSQRLPSVRTKDSSDETSDQDSDSNNDFIALPQEFRPNIKPHLQKQTKDDNTSLNKTRTKKSIQSSASQKLTDSSSGKKTFHNSTNQDMFQNKEDNLFNHDPSVLETSPQLKIQYQIVKQDHFHQEAKSKSFTEISKNVSKAEKSLARQKLNIRKDIDIMREQRAFLSANEAKNKKLFKYEQIQTEELRTIKLNFNNLSLKETDSVLKEGLKYETILERNSRSNHKNVTHRENRIMKQNTKKKSILSDGQFSVSSEQNIVKWDSSLLLNNDNKIEWNIIREKTSLTLRRKVKSLQLNDEPIFKDCPTNQATTNFHKKKFNNPVQQRADNNHRTKPTAIRKANVVHKKSNNSKNFEPQNNLLSNNSNLDYTHTVTNLDSTSDSDTGECICPKHQSADGRKNVENRLRGNSSYGTTVTMPNKRNSANQRTEPILTGNKNQNGFFSLRQVKNDFKLPSHNFQNSTSETTVKSSIGDYDHAQPMSVGNIQQNGFSQLQQTEDSLSMSACLNSHKENSSAELYKDLEEKKKFILRYGRDTSDLIIGSYTALSMFISFYREWVIARKELIDHFEELKLQLKESSTKFSKFKNVIQIANTGAAVATAIPHPITSTAAKVVTAITSLLQTFLNNQTEKSNIDDSDETARAILKDNRTSSDLYIYGLQCSQQFEETTKLIEQFHSSAHIQGFIDRENPEITRFLQGFLEFKPNHRTFYKKLHKCFQELLQSSNTNFSRKFCEPFILHSLLAVDVIGHLNWRFRMEDFDGSSARYALEELHRLIQNSGSISLTDLQKRIQNCIGILTDELEFIDIKMKDITLFDNSLENISGNKK